MSYYFAVVESMELQHIASCPASKIDSTAQCTWLCCLILLFPFGLSVLETVARREWRLYMANQYMEKRESIQVLGGQITQAVLY